MKKSKIFFLLFFSVICLLSNSQSAFSQQQNIFGLHLTQDSDIHQAKDIINSSNADWGWATIVIPLNNLNHSAWQNFFNNCRRYHVIPIVRLATTQQNAVWQSPSYQDIDQLTTFLNSLNWPTKTQHVILFNEPNQSKEWGEKIDPEHYTDIAIYTSKKLKKLNPNFYILSTGLDLASPDKNPQFMSADTFYSQIAQYKLDYFDNVDAIASHSYPNPGFVGKPTDTGKFSILGYQWELNYLKSLGINKNFPIFITETGWPHREGESNNNQFYTLNTTTDFLKSAIQTWQQDTRIQAITPFIFNYPYLPFDHFSWIDKQENLYPQYQKIINIPKQQNNPQQITKFEFVKRKLPFIIFPQKKYLGKIKLKNTGQSIWGENETSFCLSPQSTVNVNLSPICTNHKIIEPGQTHEFKFTFQIISPETTFSKTFISWENIDPIQLTPVIRNTPIFRPKTNLKEKTSAFFKKIWKFL
ncbi:glycoside hydrolase family 5 protein [Patescibacteria group bacterium]|nr:glycoside hydrolase family 5 protein [Patescibacteria group bacterium]